MDLVDRVIDLLCHLWRTWVIWMALVTLGWLYGPDLHFPVTLFLFIPAVLLNIAISVIPHVTWRM